MNTLSPIECIDWYLLNEINSFYNIFLCISHSEHICFTFERVYTTCLSKFHRRLFFHIHTKIDWKIQKHMLFTHQVSIYSDCIKKILWKIFHMYMNYHTLILAFPYKIGEGIPILLGKTHQIFSKFMINLWTKFNRHVEKL